VHILTYKYVITFTKNDILYVVLCNLLFSLTVDHRYDRNVTTYK
jgi:hypothetical protein